MLGQRVTEAAARPSSAGGRPRWLNPSFLLFLALTVANASNYVFQVVMSRQMGPRLYSLLGGVYAVITVVGVSTSALQTAAAKAAASPKSPGTKSGDPLLRLTVQLGLVLTVLLLVASPWVSAYLRSGIGPAVSLAFYVLPAGLFAIAVGRLQGLQAFGALAGVSLFLAFGRLGLGPVALAAGLGVTSIVLVSVLVTAVAAGWALRYTRHAPTAASGAMAADLKRAGCAVLLFWAVLSLDVPHARNALPEVAAGQYAAAAAIGKAVLWLPASVSLVMFPRVVQLREEGPDPLPVLLRALMTALALGAGAVLGLFLFGERLLPSFFGPEYVVAAELAWKIGLASLPFAIVNVMIFYHLTRARNRFLLGLAAALGLEIVLLSLVPPDPEGICLVLGGTGSLLLVAITAPGIRRRLLSP